MLDVVPSEEQTGRMTRKLKRIAPLQLAKMLGVLYGLMGLVFLPFFLLFALLGAMLPSGSQQAAGAGVMAAGGMVIMGILMPVMYAFFGFVFGAISAWLYNLVASWIGGIEVEVE